MTLSVYSSIIVSADDRERNWKAANIGMKETLQHLSYDTKSKNRLLQGQFSPSPLSLQVEGNDHPKWVNDLWKVLKTWRAKIPQMEKHTEALKGRVVTELETKLENVVAEMGEKDNELAEKIEELVKQYQELSIQRKTKSFRKKTTSPVH